MAHVCASWCFASPTAGPAPGTGRHQKGCDEWSTSHENHKMSQDRDESVLGDQHCFYNEDFILERGHASLGVSQPKDPGDNLNVEQKNGHVMVHIPVKNYTAIKMKQYYMTQS